MWKPIAKTGGKYEVNELGQVRKVGSQYIIKVRANRDGYPYFTRLLTPDRKKVTTVYIHRAVAEAFYGPSTLTVNHIDRNKENNRLANLEYVTQRENDIHRGRVGRPRRKQAQKLRTDIVLVIAQDRTLNNEAMAAKVGTSRYVVRDIRLGKTYSKVTKIERVAV